MIVKNKTKQKQGLNYLFCISNQESNLLIAFVFCSGKLTKEMQPNVHQLKYWKVKLVSQAFGSRNLHHYICGNLVWTGPIKP